MATHSWVYVKVGNLRVKIRADKDDGSSRDIDEIKEMREMIDGIIWYMKNELKLLDTNDLEQTASVTNESVTNETHEHAAECSVMIQLGDTVAEVRADKEERRSRTLKEVDFLKWEALHIFEGFLTGKLIHPAEE